MQENTINKNILLNNFFIDMKFEKQYIQKLKKKTFLFNNIKDKNYKILITNVQFSNNDKSFENFSLVSYIVDITFSKNNTFLVLMDYFGNIKFFCSTGFLKSQNKKRSRFVVVQDFYRLLISKFKFLKRESIALHLKNVGFSKSWIIKRFKKKFFVKVIKNFNKYPYNGCRKRKVKRKKFKKKTKKRRNG